MADPYNCPTGTCEEDEPPCRRVKPGDAIDPNSREHRERNACNRCPKLPPQRQLIQPRHGRRPAVFALLDSEGNTWAPDNAVTAWWYHSDPFPGMRDSGNMTYRLKRLAGGGRAGWQCRYVNGKLDDSSRYMGTYDYGEPGTATHYSMDVNTHDAVDTYVPNLTEQF